MAQAPNPNARRSMGVAVAFFGVGAAFMAMGATGRSAMFGVGAAFMALGVVFLARGTRAKKDGGEGTS